MLSTLNHSIQPFFIVFIHEQCPRNYSIQFEAMDNDYHGVTSIIHTFAAITVDNHVDDIFHESKPCIFMFEAKRQIDLKLEHQRGSGGVELTKIK